MTSLLAQWLTRHRTVLLPAWVQSRVSVVSGEGTEDTIQPLLAERSLLHERLYDSLIMAADGTTDDLENCLRMMRALRTTPTEDGVAEMTEELMHLRRTGWDIIFTEELNPLAARYLIERFTSLLDQAIQMLTAFWVVSANHVAEQLQQTELLLENLNTQSDMADQLAVQIGHLNDLARSLASSLDGEQLFMTVADKLIDILQVQRVGLWVFDETLPSRFRLLSLRPDTGQQSAILQPCATALAAFDTLTTGISATPAGAQPTAGCPPGWAMMATPLVSQERALGVLVVQQPGTESVFTPQQREFVESAASQIAMAIQNAQLYRKVRDFNADLENLVADRTRELQVERDILETLRQIAHDAGSTLDVTELLDNSLTLLASLAGAEHGSVMLIDRETDHLVDRMVLNGTDTVGYTRFALGQGIAGWVALHRTPLHVADVSTDERWVDLPSARHGQLRRGSMIISPLIVHNEVLGVIILSHHQKGFFTTDHFRLIVAASGPIALGLHNAQMYEEIQMQLLRQGEMLRNERRATTQSTAILQSLSDGVMVCDTEARLITVNLAAERMLGRTIEELLTWDLRDLLQRVLGAQAHAFPIAQVLRHPFSADGKPQGIAGNVSVDGRVLRITIDPVITNRGEEMGAVMVLRDITRESESDRLKDEFIGTVSHELRTPMTSIKGYTQLLSMGSLGPINDAQREFLKTISSNADRMISIINDLLDITKVETGAVELDIRPIHLTEALGNVILELQGQINVRQHELSVTLTPNLSLIRADARRFNQVLLQLLSNAVRYTPQQGKITVAAHDATLDAVPIQLRQGMREGRYVIISVCDTGVGIASHDLELIFERFYRTENPLKIEAGGTGLGLALVRPLVRMFHGCIWVESVVGGGSCFHLALPAA